MAIYTVGILTCGSKNDHTVRYSLGRATSPMAVASYAYDALTAEFRKELPDACSIMTRAWGSRIA